MQTSSEPLRNPQPKLVQGAAAIVLKRLFKAKHRCALVERSRAMPLGPVQPNSRHRYGPGAEYVVTKVPMGKSTVTGYYHDDKENCPPFGAKKGVDAQPSIDDIVANWKTRALKSATKAPKKRSSVSRTRKARRSTSCPPENAALLRKFGPACRAPPAA